ncbi:MAG: S8 family serine peptidase [Phycisphaeraceae bacterium]|nr:S8 family serine peptidase [Phycisphaeraceae bacterium]
MRRNVIRFRHQVVAIAAVSAAAVGYAAAVDGATITDEIEPFRAVHSNGSASSPSSDFPDQRPSPALLVRMSESMPDGGMGHAKLRSVLAEHPDCSVRSALMHQPADSSLAIELGLDRWVIVDGFADDVARQDVRRRLRASSGVEIVEDDTIGGLHGGCLPNDPLIHSQWWALNSGQRVQGVAGVPGADSRVAETWCFTRGHSAVVIAVLDTGVSQSHPDLQGNVLPGYNFFNNNAYTDDNQNLSHGTFCAGIALARAHNGIGIAGIAPGCSLLPVKVLSGSFGSETSTANGLIFAADRGAKVASMSLGFSQGSTFFRDAVLYARARDVVMVASTGNSPGSEVGYPARWSSVIAVGATDNLDMPAVFQTAGNEMDLCAPGVNIMTTTDTFTVPDGYSLQSGTSMAAPMVAGVAALVRSIRPSLTAEQVREVLISTTKDLGAPGWDPVHGWGRIDAIRAVREAVMFGRRGTPDFNLDGVVDLQDLLAFLEYWLIGAVDYNNDGVWDLSDLLDFLAVWLG